MLFRVFIIACCLQGITLQPGIQSELEPADNALKPGNESEAEPSGTSLKPGNESEAEPSSTSLIPGNQSEAEPSSTSLKPGNQSEAEPSGTSLKPGNESEAEPSSTSLIPGNESEAEPSATPLKASNQSETELAEHAQSSRHMEKPPHAALLHSRRHSDHVQILHPAHHKPHIHPPAPNGYGIFQLDNGEDKLFRIRKNEVSTHEEGETLCQSYNEESTNDKDSKQEYFYTLLTVPTRRFQKFIQKFVFGINGVKDNVWLGLKDSDGILRWNGVKELNFTNWAAQAEPTKNHKCVQMDFGNSHKAGLWSKVDCAKKNVVVCEALKLEGSEILRNQFLNHKLQMRKQRQGTQDLKVPNTTNEIEKVNETLYANETLLQSVKHLEQLVTDARLENESKEGKNTSLELNSDGNDSEMNSVSLLQSRRLEAKDESPDNIYYDDLARSFIDLQKKFINFLNGQSAAEQNITLLLQNARTLTWHKEGMEESITGLEREVSHLEDRNNKTEQNNSNLIQTVKDLHQNLTDLSLRMKVAETKITELERNLAKRSLGDKVSLHARRNLDENEEMKNVGTNLLESTEFGQNVTANETESGINLQKRRNLGENEELPNASIDKLEKKMLELGNNLTNLQQTVTDLKLKNEASQRTNLGLEKNITDLKTTNEITEQKNSALKQRIMNVERQLETVLQSNEATQQKSANADQQNRADLQNTKSVVEPSLGDQQQKPAFLSSRRAAAADSEERKIDEYPENGKEILPKTHPAVRNAATGQDTNRDIEIILSVQKRTFHGASESCKKIHGGSLLVIHDQETQNRAAQLLDKIAEFEPVWIGLNGTIIGNVHELEDPKTTFFMHWANGLTYNVHSFSSFVSGHPDIKGHACVHMDKTGLVTMPYGWAATEDCDQLFRYFCQFVHPKLNVDSQGKLLPGFMT